MKDFKKVLIFMLVICACFLMVPKLSIADFGDFESYDSGGWDSDWDSSSSWDSDWGSSSSWDSDYSSSGGYYSSGSSAERSFYFRHCNHCHYYLSIKRKRK